MFKVVDKRRFWWPVTVRVPSVEYPGQIQEHNFEMLFEGMSKDRALEIDAKRAKLAPPEQDVFDYLSEVSKDWRDVVGDDERPVPFTPETFASFLQVSWHRDAVRIAYTQAMSGQAARLGNSAGPLAG